MGLKMVFRTAKLRVILCVLFIFEHIAVGNGEVLRPRGVSLSKKIFYDPRKEFTCLDGSGTVPFSFVNDDYCDCEDGSDEPGELCVLLILPYVVENGVILCFSYKFTDVWFQ
ncbi:uncharacterized protein LOC111083864, partial [Limulus polyphemus]|uniref:Uncharacterized protein LOC111083864 n=1 Tax=Limulus polyphemus TaxID=6850 RepID=A0ABM1RY28_LIMPO